LHCAHDRSACIVTTSTHTYIVFCYFVVTFRPAFEAAKAAEHLQRLQLQEQQPKQHQPQRFAASAEFTHMMQQRHATEEQQQEQWKVREQQQQQQRQ
jgi:hypothetical protein